VCLEIPIQFAREYLAYKPKVDRAARFEAEADSNYVPYTCYRGVFYEPAGVPNGEAFTNTEEIDAYLAWVDENFVPLVNGNFTFVGEGDEYWTETFFDELDNRGAGWLDEAYVLYLNTTTPEDFDAEHEYFDIDQFAAIRSEYLRSMQGE
jgi:hypothetical protein